MMIPKPIADEIITYQGRIIELVTQKMQLGDKEIDFEIARRSPGTRLLIVSPDGKILLTKEYRGEIGDWDFRLPGGKVFDSLKEYNQALEEKVDLLEAAKKAAQKEALEEVGVKAKDIKHLYTSRCGATVEWDLYYFLVKLSSEKLGKQHLEDGEDIQVAWYSPEDALKLALSGSISEDRSAAVLIRSVLTID